MNESGASISEIRALAAFYEKRGPNIPIVVSGHYRDAILVEALLLLAAKKEAERA